MHSTKNVARTALHGIAVLEGAKGLMVLLAGAGLLALLHRDAQALASEFIAHLHLNPANHYPRIFVELAGKLTDARLWWLALGAFGYALLRLIEAYGLWRERRWAAWLGALSSGIYVPLELYALLAKPNLLHTLLLLLNAVVVGILVWTLVRVPSGINCSHLR